MQINDFNIKNVYIDKLEAVNQIIKMKPVDEMKQ